ncbi:MAG TPA: glycosyltransferase family 4 protein [Actinomycetota bacterium]|nr:glycosyltransferase family 4 protein [Actinomycetota bacterium]HRY09865.1 glycosyltransferase family 4 protein [Candidatus Nanopelagicales bacterium]
MPNRVLIIVQNLPVPLDRRVWLECCALREAGYTVSVICPKAPDDPDFEVIDGIEVHKYDPPPHDGGFWGYVREFVVCWLATARRARRIWKTSGFDAMQACNPPDTYWLLGRIYRRRGVFFVFDQHDLNPELFISRFGEVKGLAHRLEYWGLKWLEKMTYRTSDHVIVTNRSYAAIAQGRGGVDAADLTIVRSGPDTKAMRPLAPTGNPCPPGKSMIVYLGIMGPQDGVDLFLRAMAVLVHELGRTDVFAALLGFGDSFEDLKHLAGALNLNGHVQFLGRADQVMVADYLSAATVAVGPDPKSPLNDVSTMNKIMEYMAYALPIVTFDLRETRISAGGAAKYVEPGDVEGFAEAIAHLLDDPDERLHLGLEARRRVASQLDWQSQAHQYVSVYDRLLSVEREQPDDTWPVVDRRQRQVPLDDLRDSEGRTLANLRDSAELGHFVVNRQLHRDSVDREHPSS